MNATNAGRTKTQVTHITIAHNGGLHCERCGAVHHIHDSPGFLSRGQAWMREHKECRPQHYVS